MQRTLIQRTLSFFVGGKYHLKLTSCFTGLDSAALLMLNKIHIYKFSRIQTSQTGGRPYSDTSPYKVTALLFLD